MVGCSLRFAARLSGARVFPRVLAALFAACLLLAGAPAHADPPQALILLPITGGSIGFSIQVRNIQYTKTDLAALAGTGDLVFTALGGTPVTVSGLPFQNVSADQNGVVRGAGIVLTKPL